MPRATPRRKPVSRPTPDTIVVTGEYTIDLTSLRVRVGKMPDTVADCVAAAVRMWSGKYHNPYYGANRDAEIVSIVWELMLTAPAHATVSSVAHWACLHLINNKHLERNGQGRSIHRRAERDAMPTLDDDEYPMHYCDPAEAGGYQLDYDAFYASLSRDERTMLDMMLAGYCAREIGRLAGWNWWKNDKLFASMRRKYQRMHFSTPQASELIRQLLASASVAA